MRRAAVVASVLLAALSSVACRPSGEKYDETIGADTVKVMIRCEGPLLTATVNPYSLNVAENHGVEWVLDSASNVEEIEIRAKDAGKWPYKGQPYKAKKNAAGKADSVKANPKGTHGYAISAECDLGQTKKKIVIDPDIIIIWN